MPAINWADSLAKELLEKIHNFASGGDVIKLALSNVAITAAVTNLSGITEIAAGGGYSTGGIALTTSTSSPVTGQGALVIASPTLSASGTVAAFRYGLIYNSTAGNKAVGWLDEGAAVNLTVGNSHTFNITTAYALAIGP